MLTIFCIKIMEKVLKVITQSYCKKVLIVAHFLSKVTISRFNSQVIIFHFILKVHFKKRLRCHHYCLNKLLSMCEKLFTLTYTKEVINALNFTLLNLINCFLANTKIGSSSFCSFDLNFPFAQPEKAKTTTSL